MHHGHSHRSGAAAQQWREPKPLVITVVCFLLFVVYTLASSSSSSPPHLPASSSVNNPPLSGDIQSVVWVQPATTTNASSSSVSFAGVGVMQRELDARMPVSCDARAKLASALYRNEIGLVRSVSCRTVECAWSMHEVLAARPSVPLLLASRALLDKVEAMQLARGRRLLLLLPAPDVEHASVVAADALSASINCHAVFPVLNTRALPCDGDDGEYVARDDLKLCVQREQQCAALTAKACSTSALSVACRADCEALFAKEVRGEVLLWHTMKLCLITLFLLGCVLGLLFAKLYWVDPLLDQNEHLMMEQHQHGHEQHGHSHSSKVKM